MNNVEVSVGAEVLIARFAGSRWDYTPAKVTRTTKARIFVKCDWEGAGEREFNSSNLEERSKGNGGYYKEKLFVYPAEIKAIIDEQEAKQVRRLLEIQAEKSLERAFGNVRYMTDNELNDLIIRFPEVKSST